MFNRKFNDQTGHFKIDIFFNGKYVCSTDQSANVRKAKERFIELRPELSPICIQCRYYNPNE
jgi:hypothetical protein